MISVARLVNWSLQEQTSSATSEVFPCCDLICTTVSPGYHAVLGKSYHVAAVAVDNNQITLELRLKILEIFRESSTILSEVFVLNWYEHSTYFVHEISSLSSVPE